MVWCGVVGGMDEICEAGAGGEVKIGKRTIGRGGGGTIVSISDSDSDSDRDERKRDVVGTCSW